MRAANNKKAFLSNVFHDVLPSKDGSEISVRCPFCGKPGKSKMCIIIETDVYHCWVCEAKGRGLTKLISITNPNKVEEGDNRTPQEIIAEIEELDAQGAQALQAIKELL